MYDLQEIYSETKMLRNMVFHHIYGIYLHTKTLDRTIYQTRIRIRVPTVRILTRPKKFRSQLFSKSVESRIIFMRFWLQAKMVGSGSYLIY
jgi:hypothetical protein